MNQRGSVILHVLVTGVAVALIAALLLRMTMLRAVVTSRSHKASQMKRFDEAALARLQSNWSSGQMCTSFPGYTCAGATAGYCGCTCTPSSAGDPIIYTSPSGSAPCQLSIQSPDLAPPPQ